MSKKANPTVIGAFVIGAIVLIAAGTAIFGGAELLANKTRIVAYFPISVKGLRVGSNVVARGVRVGYVDDIQLLGDIDTLETQVQVTMEIFPDAFVATRQGRVIGSVAGSGRSLQSIIDAGLRAQLGIESFVTGQLLVNLDFYPETPPLFRGEDPPYVEVPTIPSSIQQFLEDIEGFVADLQKNVDIKAVVTDLAGAVNGANKLINSEQLPEIIAGINSLINAEETQRLTANLQGALKDLRSTLDDTRSFVNSTGEDLGELKNTLIPAINNLSTTLTEAEQAIGVVEAQLSRESEVSFEFINTLNEVQRAARSLRVLTDYLERHPEALLRGKDGG